MKDLKEILRKAYDRGFNDATNGYDGPDMADIADLVLEATTDDMETAEYQSRARQVADSYANGYDAGKETK